MKLNVDLTEDSIFNRVDRISGTLRRGIINASFPKLFLSSNYGLNNKIKHNIADIPYCIEVDIQKSQLGGIIQGNKNERYFRKIENEEIIVCDRCGRLKKYPWEEFIGSLCCQCNIEIKKER